ncbi:FHA domain-containing protein [Roseiflexus sp.]|uniref:FHA domain-containing protein n=1 Tax=Roseiflexus sp. TaxID=2562120 RepID=UPI00398A6FFE
MTEYELWRYLETYAQMSNTWWYSVAVLPATIISGSAYFLMWLALRRTRQLPKMFLWLCVSSLPVMLVLPSFYVSVDLTGALAYIEFAPPASAQQISRAAAIQVGVYLSQVATLGIIGASLAFVVLIAAILVGGYAPPQVIQTVQSMTQSLSKAMTRAFGPPRVNRVISKHGSLTVTRGAAQQNAKFGVTPGAIIGKTNATIVITDPVVSRRHARLDVQNDTVFLIDLGSTNGTFIKRDNREIEVNGSPVELRYGDRIYLGAPSEVESVELVYEPPPAGGQP